jgi:hypothetical protein
MSHQSNGPEKQGHLALVLEIVLYRLQEGVGQETILTLSDEIQKWLVQQPGYLHRELFMAEDGQWLDLVHWSSMVEAKAASEKIFTQPFAANFGNIFAPDATGLHMYQLRNYSTMAIR